METALTDQAKYGKELFARGRRTLGVGADGSRGSHCYPPNQTLRLDIRKNFNIASSQAARATGTWQRGRETHSTGLSSSSNQTLVSSGFVLGPPNGKRRPRVAGRSSSPTGPPRKKTRKASDGALVPASASESDEIEEISPYSIGGPGPATLRSREERARQEEEDAFETPQAPSADDFDNPFGITESPTSDISPEVENLLDPPEVNPRQLHTNPRKQEKKAPITKHPVSRPVLSPDVFTEDNGPWKGTSTVPQSNSPPRKALQATRSIPKRPSGKGKAKATPGTSVEHAISVDDHVSVGPERTTTTGFLSPISTTKSSSKELEEDPIQCSDQEHGEVNARGLGHRSPVLELVANRYEKNTISDARSPSIPSGKVLVLREHWEGVARSEPPASRTLPKLYGLHNATKTPIPVPLAGSRGPTVNGSRLQQKLSKSMGTREDSTNYTLNKSSNTTAHKMQENIPPKSRNPKIDPDTLPIKAFFYGGQMAESVPNDSSRQYFLQWGSNSLSFVDQAKLEASAASNGRQFGKAQLSVFMWGDIFDVVCSNDPSNNPTILSFRVRDQCLRNYGLKGGTKNNQFVIEFDLGHKIWNEQRYFNMRSRLRSAVPPAMDVDRSGSSALLDFARTSLDIPTVEDEKAPISTGSGEAGTAMTSAATLPKRTSERMKTAPLRLRDRANGTAVEDQSTDGDDGISKAESESLLSTTREDDSNLRRSKRQRAAPLAVNLNDNELLFSYPPVNITRGDFGRLEPDEFLNDTLIEFGLKLWQNDLKEKNPQLADDIWVFNSFFYKKLSNRKVEGYPSVKKWTAKVDIFRKKFIIVPINENLHWYLAIIYQPGASLHPVTKPKTPPPPPTTRASLKHSVQTKPRNVNSAPLSPPPEMEAASGPNTDIEDSMEVDQELLGGDDSAKSPIADRGPTSPLYRKPSLYNSVDGSEGGPAVDDEGDVEMASRFPGTSEPSSIKDSDAEGPRVEAPHELLGYASPDDEPSHPPDIGELAKKFSLLDDTSSDDLSLNEDAKTLPDEIPKPMDLESSSTGPTEQTYIFILDSLGSKHPSVFNTLREWLSLEAQDKRNEEIPKLANNGKYVKVPYQPNHVDCGVYLLHFAETFVAKADQIIPLTLNTRKLDDASLRDSIFDKELLKKKRAMLKDRVIELANAWKASHPETVSISTEKRPSPSDAPNHQQESITKEADLHDIQHPSKAQVPVEDASEQASNSGERDEPVQEAAKDSLPVDSDVRTTRDNESHKPQQKPPSSVSGRPEPKEDSDDEIQFIGETKPQPPSRTKPSRAASAKGKGTRHKG
ncbi:hypothetical protein FS837_000662 [Tulasnella sp. UAMH 9824]|nr:hypothetical protein FS837_000662 [Tulasnella sp. UAMH 9824]